MLLVLTLLLWAIVHALVLPRVEQWKPWLEQRLTSAVGHPISIGALDVRSQGGAFVATLSDVRLLDAQGRTALAVAQVRAMPALSSLWSLQPRMQQIYIEGLQLDVRRDARGRLRVAGLDTSGGSAVEDDGRAVDWLLAQHEIVLRGGTLRWTDEFTQAPTLALKGVDLLVRSGLLRHQWRLDATPDELWGDRFVLMGHFSRPFLQSRHEWQHWSGTAYASLPRVDARQLGRHVRLPFELNDGRAALRAWLDVQGGQWRALTADVDLADVNVQLGPHLLPLALTSLKGRWQVSRPPEGVQIAVKGLQARTGDGHTWPAGDLDIRWQQRQSSAGPAAPVTGGQLSAQRLDLAVVAALATRLPLGTPLQGALASLAPSGEVSGLVLSWRGAPDAPEHYELRTKVRQLSLAAQAHGKAGMVGRPGLSGADIDVELSSAGGRATLAMQKGSLTFPGIFEEPRVEVNQLQADVSWTVKPRSGTLPALDVKVARARIVNDDTTTELSAGWRTGDREGSGPGGYLPGVIDLQGDIVTGRADRIAAYLPLSLPVEARHWVARAVRGGVIEQGSFAVQGDIWHIPFNHPAESGTFRIGGRLRDAQFDYLPSVPAGASEPAWVSPWPGFTQVSGDLQFNRTSMRLDKMQARMWGVQLRDVQARIDDLTRPLLRVQGEGRGPVADLLRFVDVSPVGQWLEGGLKPLSATGQGDLTLDLSVPLLQPDLTTVRGSVTLPGNDVRIRADMPLLAGARGKIDFTEKSFQIIGATARALGGEVAFDGGSLADGSLRFQLAGTATAEGLRGEPAFEPLPWVAQRLRGQTAWKGQLGVRQGRPEVTVSTDLVGMASDWPAPLAKDESSALLVRWQNTWLPGQGRAADASRDQLRLDVGNVAQLRLVREWLDDEPSAKIVAAALGLNEPAPPAVPGGPFEVKARLVSLDLDAWQAALPGMASVGSQGTSGTPRTSGTSGTSGRSSSLPGASLAAVPNADAPWPILPRWSVQGEVQNLQLAGLQLENLKLDLQEERGQQQRWAFQVKANQVQGKGVYRQPAASGDSGQLNLRLERLALPLPDAVSGRAPSPAPVPSTAGTRVPASSRWPAVDIDIDALEMRGRAVGRVSLMASPRQAGGREAAAATWNLDQMELRMPGAALQASGQWSPATAQEPDGRVALQIDLDLQDSARLATHWGWNEALRGGNGKLSGRVGWAGRPWGMELATLEGKLTLALSQGQVLRAEPGIGRLLGILSLQALPRRFLLDFRDVFQQGFAFDEVKGDISLNRGLATTQGLRMQGVQATVLIGGSADLLKETQDLRIVIAPEINAGAASLAYLAINPAIGLGTFLAQLVLRDPLRAASSREFVVTGSMAEPKVERVERQSSTGNGASAAAPPASSVSPASGATPAQGVPP